MYVEMYLSHAHVGEIPMKDCERFTLEKKFFMCWFGRIIKYSFVIDTKMPNRI